MRSVARFAFLFGLLFALSGCGGSGATPADGGSSVPDGSVPDGSVPDGSVPDGSVADGNALPDGAGMDDGAMQTRDAASPTDDADTGDANVTEDASTACAPTGLAPGDATLHLDFGGMTRTYKVHVPPSYDGSVPVPLVLNFHGYTSTADQEIALTHMNDQSDTSGFIVVYPEGVLNSWNAGVCCGTAASMDLDDVGLARAIVSAMESRACVDPHRVYATGMSNGGFLSHRIGCEAADLFAAIAPVAGVLGIPDADCTPSRPVPVMDFHGTADPIVPWGGSAGLGFPSVPDTIAGWARRDGCTGTPHTTFDHGDTHCETYDACDGGVEVTLCTVEGGGHWWPGGILTHNGIDATSAMWDFFTRYRLP